MRFVQSLMLNYTGEKLRPGLEAREWEIGTENCWYMCGQKGGRCSNCGSGYCCSALQTEINGDCPQEAVDEMLRKRFQSVWEDGIHVCATPIDDSGK